MMSLIKHDTLQTTGSSLFLFRHCLPKRIVNSSLMHHQRMIGDDEGGVAGGALVFFDEATLVVRASNINAFTTPIRQA